MSMTFVERTAFTALNIMLRSFAQEHNYEFDIEDDIEFKKVKYTFTSTVLNRGYNHVVEFEELDTARIYSLFDHIIERVKKAFNESTLYITTDLASTKELYRRFVNGVYGTCAAEPDPRESLWMTKKSGPFAWGKDPEIKDVKFADPATIVFWTDGTKTVVRTQSGDTYDPEKGLAMAICKKRDGNKWSYYNTFLHWLKKYKPETGDVETVTHTTKVIKED